MKDSRMTFIMFIVSGLFSGYITFSLTGDIKIACSAFVVVVTALLGLALAIRHTVDVVDKEERRCHNCGVKSGEFHEHGCEWEECPFCHGQLLSCNCCYEHLKIDPNVEPVHSEGLNEEQSEKWDKILEAKGLIPYGSETCF